MVNTRRRALADTSVLIGVEADRIGPDLLTDYEFGVSAVTLGELRGWAHQILITSRLGIWS